MFLSFSLACYQTLLGISKSFVLADFRKLSRNVHRVSGSFVELNKLFFMNASLILYNR